MEKLNYKPNTLVELTETERDNTKEGLLLGKTKDNITVYARNNNSHFHNEGGLTPELVRSV